MIAKNFYPFLVLRCLMALLSRGYFVPDETWQSVEVAHKLVFGNGYLTWEWRHGLRSYLHPALFAWIFQLLKVLNLDTPFLISVCPRIFQGFLSAAGDAAIVKFFQLTFAKNSASFVLIYASNWFLLYASSRTLINTLEMNLTSMALLLYVQKRTSYVGLIAIAFMMRPTTAIFWLPIVVVDVLTSKSLRQFCCQMLPQAVLVPLGVVLVDSSFYGQPWTIVPWNFLRVNLLNNVSEQYGVHPWHWYFSNFILASTLGVATYPFMKGLCKSFKSQKVIAFSFAWSFLVFSTLGHKEHRFLLPLLPLMTCFIAVGLPNFATRPWNFARPWGCLYVVANVALALYLSLIHQAGPMSVVTYLSSQPDSKGILYLTPCHGTPFYSHIHWDIPMKLLECEPNLENVTTTNNVDLFMHNPLQWLTENVHLDKFDHVVLFEKLKGVLQERLEMSGLTECEKFWHTHFPDTNTSTYLLIYCRK